MSFSWIKLEHFWIIEDWSRKLIAINIMLTKVTTTLHPKSNFLPVYIWVNSFVDLCWPSFFCWFSSRWLVTAGTLVVLCVRCLEFWDNYSSKGSDLKFRNSAPPFTYCVYVIVNTVFGNSAPSFTFLQLHVEQVLWMSKLVSVKRGGDFKLSPCAHSGVSGLITNN